MSNALLNFLKKSITSTPTKKKKKKETEVEKGKRLRKGALDYASTKAGPIGGIARQRKKHDDALKDIMDSM